MPTAGAIPADGPKPPTHQEYPNQAIALSVAGPRPASRPVSAREGDFYHKPRKTSERSSTTAPHLQIVNLRQPSTSKTPSTIGQGKKRHENQVANFSAIASCVLVRLLRYDTISRSWRLSSNNRLKASGLMRGTAARVSASCWINGEEHKTEGRKIFKRVSRGGGGHEWRRKGVFFRDGRFGTFRHH